MEFCTKLKKLRKDNGLTQEQLSDELNISRAAVSKWERGRGLPNIEALKNISVFFSIPIDDLLSEGSLFCSKANEDQTNRSKFNCFIYGILDLFVMTFIFLPFYGNVEENFIRAVNLLEYDINSHFKVIYYGLLILTATWGIVEIAAHHFGSFKTRRFLRISSILLQTISIFLFIMTREPYLTFMLFALLLIKFILLKDLISKTKSTQVLQMKSISISSSFNG